MEKYELEEGLIRSFFEEVLNESVLMGVDDNGLGITEYGEIVNGSSGGLLSEVGIIVTAYVEVGGNSMFSFNFEILECVKFQLMNIEKWIY